MTDKQRFTVTEDGGREVHLEKPLTTHSGPLSSIKLRAPNFADFVDLGDPTTLIVTQNCVFPQDDMNIFKSYILRLSKMDELVLERATLVDAIAMRDAVRDFFASASGSTSTGSPIT